MILFLPLTPLLGISTGDGSVYAIRRVEHHRVTNEHALSAGEVWLNVQHPSIVSLREIFLSKEFNTINCEYADCHRQHRWTINTKIELPISVSGLVGWVRDQGSVIRLGANNLSIYLLYLALQQLYFVYDFYPGAETIEQRLTGGYVSETVLWSYISQLSHIHSA